MANLGKLYSQVAIEADTKGTKINAAETSRVCMLLMKRLAALPGWKLGEYLAAVKDRHGLLEPTEGDLLEDT